MATFLRRGTRTALEAARSGRADWRPWVWRVLLPGMGNVGEGELRLAAEAESRGFESGVPDMRNDVEVNRVVVVGVPWLWCIAGCLAWWVLVAWAVERLV